MVRASRKNAIAVAAATLAVACSQAPSDHTAQSSANALGGWPACGTVLTTIDSPNGAVEARSNEGLLYDDCTSLGQDGDRYQCVELAQRYFRVAFGVYVTRVATAAEMCGIEESGLRVESPTAYVPVHGDLMVFPATSTNYAGHVAIVDWVDGDLANVVEQNSTMSGRSAHGLVTASCFLHADANDAVAAPPPPPDPCATLSVSYSAWYCSGHDGVGGDPGSAYHCENGASTDSVVCPNDCVPVNGAADDYCE